MHVFRLIYSSRVIGDEICYDIKDALQVFELCHTRMSLHKRIYSHKTAKSVEYMIVDALMKAEPVMHIANRLEDPKEYLYLTDAIQLEIEASKDPVSLYPVCLYGTRRNETDEDICDTGSGSQKQRRSCTGAGFATCTSPSTSRSSRGIVRGN